MAYKRQQQYSQSFVLPDIDHRMAIWQAYMNCQNSFLGIAMFGASGQEGSINISRTPQETFVYCLGVLDAYLETDKDDEFKKDNPNLEGLLDKYPPNEYGRFEKFSEYFRYWKKCQALMVRVGFYNIRDLTAHI